MKELFLVTVSLLASFNALAMNKCIDPKGGVQYQQEACPGTAETIGDSIKRKKEEREAFEQDAKLYGKPGADVPDSICAKDIAKWVKFKDPRSIIIEKTTRMSPEIKYVSGVKIVTKVHGIHLNGKNSYGAYVGEKLYVCRLSENEQEIYSIGDY